MCRRIANAKQGEANSLGKGAAAELLHHTGEILNAGDALCTWIVQCRVCIARRWRSSGRSFPSPTHIFMRRILRQYSDCAPGRGTCSPRTCSKAFGLPAPEMREMASVAQLRASSALAAFQDCVDKFEAVATSGGALLHDPRRFWVDSAVIMSTRALCGRELRDPRVEAAFLRLRVQVAVVQVLMERLNMSASALYALSRRARRWVDAAAVPATAESSSCFTEARGPRTRFAAKRELVASAV